MGVEDPAAWVKNVERLYRASDAAAVSELYTADCTVRAGAALYTPEEVHRHPFEWFGSLDEYEITRTFRAADGDIIVSETVATYTKKSVDPDAIGDDRYRPGQRYREFGVDIYWVNDEGRIYHKHVLETVEAFELRELQEPVHE
jgi:SnoaL-like protein